jgi:hypothetical protein
MPNLFVVGTEKNLAELAPSLLRSRTSAAVRESALDAIREANPGLDFDRITPGTVVLVPPVEGVRPAAVTGDPVHQAADDLIARVRDGVDALVAGADAAEEQRALDKKEAQELFGTALVKRLSGQSAELATNIESVRATFKQDDVEARRQLTGVHESRDVWTADLDALRALLLP